MMKTLRTIKIGPNPPDINSVWLYKGTMKYFNNGNWLSIGSSEYELPEATATTLGGIKQGIKVNNLVSTDTLPTVINAFNTLLGSLRGAGVINT